MTAPRITVRALGDGWVVSVGDAADGWFATTPEAVAGHVVALTCRDDHPVATPRTVQPAPPISVADQFREIASKIDRLTLEIASVSDRRAA